jgi:hypothetical protein
MTTSKIILTLSILGIGGAAYYFWNKNKVATIADNSKKTNSTPSGRAETLADKPISTTEGYYKAAEHAEVVAAIKNNDLVVNTTLTPTKPVSLVTQPFNSPKVGVIIPVSNPTVIISTKPAATVSNDDDGCQWTSTCW